MNTPLYVRIYHNDNEFMRRLIKIKVVKIIFNSNEKEGLFDTFSKLIARLNK